MYAYICERTESGKVWTAQYADVNQYLQIDLGTVMKVSGVFTQGHPTSDQRVTSYSLQFSDKNRDDWFTYLDHNGINEVVFDGNHDSYSISEGILRQPVTARYVRVLPRTWNKKISMRVDVIGCKAGETTDCLQDGNSYAEFGAEFTVACPTDCDKVQPTHVIGGGGASAGKYSLESSVCQAAIHDGRITAHTGGTVTFRLDGKAPSAGYEGSAQHGIISTDGDTDHNAMFFESDHIGCEAGWKGYRNSCYRIPKNANQNRKSWSDAQNICKEEGGWLAIVPDQATAEFLYSIIRDNNDLNHLWIGLTDNGHPNYYEKWSDPDQTPVSFLRWDRNQPRDKGSTLNCVLAYRISFLFANNDCERHTNYICERPKRPTNHVDPEEEGCKAGWQGYGDRCYLFVQQPKIYFWAKSYCEGLEPGKSFLATVSDNGINAHLAAKVNEWIQPSDHVSFNFNTTKKTLNSAQNVDRYLRQE